MSEVEAQGASAETWCLVCSEVDNMAALWARDEAACALALEEHDAAVRTCARARGGTDVSHHDGAFLLAFTDALEAGAFAVELQRQLRRHPWPQPLPPLRVRIGLHWGRVRRAGLDFRGPAVHLAESVARLAEPGEIRVTGEAARRMQSVAQLAGRLEALGWVHVPGREQDVELYSLRCGRPPVTVRREWTDADRDRWRLAKHEIREGRADGALLALMPLARAHPDSYHVLSAMGLAYALAKQFRKAQRYLARALQQDPMHASGWFNLARVYGRLGRRDKLARCLELALQANPKHRKARAAAARYGVRVPPLAGEPEPTSDTGTSTWPADAATGPLAPLPPRPTTPSTPPRMPWEAAEALSEDEISALFEDLPEPWFVDEEPGEDPEPLLENPPAPSAPTAASPVTAWHEEAPAAKRKGCLFGLVGWLVR